MTMQLDNVGYKVAGRSIIKNLSIDIIPGKVSVIIGPNGAGKSTVLSLLSGDIAPSYGCVLMDAVPLTTLGVRHIARHRAVLPQLGQSNFAFTAMDIVRMGRIPHDEAPEHPNAVRITDCVMAETGTSHLKRQDITTLSGGERQRVNLARVLAQVWDDRASLEAPKYLLLDEPISALDPKYQLRILRLLKNYAERGYGVALVLHDMTMAAMFADMVYIMDAGECLYSGPPSEVMTADVLSKVWQIPYHVRKIDGHLRPIIAA